MEDILNHIRILTNSIDLIQEKGNKSSLDLLQLESLQESRWSLIRNNIEDQFS